jgi:hypothetical protein
MHVAPLGQTIKYCSAVKRYQVANVSKLKGEAYLSTFDRGYNLIVLLVYSDHISLVNNVLHNNFFLIKHGMWSMIVRPLSYMIEKLKGLS